MTHKTPTWNTYKVKTVLGGATIGRLLHSFINIVEPELTEKVNTQAGTCSKHKESRRDKLIEKLNHTKEALVSHRPFLQK